MPNLEPILWTQRHCKHNSKYLTPKNSWLLCLQGSLWKFLWTILILVSFSWRLCVLQVYPKGKQKPLQVYKLQVFEVSAPGWESNQSCDWSPSWVHPLWRPCPSKRCPSRRRQDQQSSNSNLKSRLVLKSIRPRPISILNLLLVPLVQPDLTIG